MAETVRAMIPHSTTLSTLSTHTHLTTHKAGSFHPALRGGHPQSPTPDPAPHPRNRIHHRPVATKREPPPPGYTPQRGVILLAGRMGEGEGERWQWRKQSRPRSRKSGLHRLPCRVGLVTWLGVWTLQIEIQGGGGSDLGWEWTWMGKL